MLPGDVAVGGLVGGFGLRCRGGLKGRLACGRGFLGSQLPWSGWAFLLLGRQGCGLAGAGAGALPGADQAVGFAAFLAAASGGVEGVGSGLAGVLAVVGGGGHQVVGGFEGGLSSGGQGATLGGGGGCPVAFGAAAQGHDQAVGAAGAGAAQLGLGGGDVGRLDVGHPVEVAASGAGSLELLGGAQGLILGSRDGHDGTPGATSGGW